MENQKIDELKLNITTDQKEVVLLVGQAEKVIKPLKVNINGTIESPSEYYIKRKEDIAKNNSHLEVNHSDKTIKMVIGENIENNIIIVGTAKIHKDFLELGINSEKTYSLASLAKAIKFKGVYFKDRDAHEKLITNLLNFTVKVEQEFKNANDFKGSAANSKATEIKHAIPLDFVLNMPIILGQQAKEFPVEVCMDASNGSVELWLESVSLKSEMDKIVADLLESEIKKFNDELVVITVG